MIPDASALRKLERLLKLCRKQGVTEIVWDGLSLKLGDQSTPERKRTGKRAAAETEPDTGGWTHDPELGLIPPGMTREEFMFGSSPSPTPSEG